MVCIYMFVIFCVVFLVFFAVQLLFLFIDVGFVINREVVFFFFKEKTAYEWRIIDWSSDVCSSDLLGQGWTFRTSRLRHCLVSQGRGLHGSQPSHQGRICFHQLNQPRRAGRNPLERSSGTRCLYPLCTSNIPVDERSAREGSSALRHSWLRSDRYIPEMGL